MSKIGRFVIWICSKFKKSAIEKIIAGLIDILQDRNPEVKPKEDFQEKHPHYRDSSLDPLAPLTEPHHEKQEQVPDGSLQMPERIRSPGCNVPHDYLYYNDGKKRSQLLCKVCGVLLVGEEVPQGHQDHLLLSLLPTCPLYLATEERGDPLEMR